MLAEVSTEVLGELMRLAEDAWPTANVGTRKRLIELLCQTLSYGGRPRNVVLQAVAAALEQMGQPDA